MRRTWQAAALAALVASVASGAPAERASSKDRARDRGGVIRVEHRDPGTLPAKGPTNALVTVEIFFTPGPLYRRDIYKNLEKLQANHPTRVRLVYRVIKGNARFPYAALHAYAEGKFFEFIDALNSAPRALDDKALLDLGTRLGLDPDRLAQAITKPPAAYDEVLDANERRRRQRIRGNPSLPNILFNGRVPASTMSTMTMNDLEREYAGALDRARDLLDHGVSADELASAFDQIVRLPEEVIVTPGATDEEIEDMSTEPHLATPALSYAGLPSHGSAEPAITIAVLCSPTSTNCNAPLSTAQRIADRYADQVRVVWGPYFDVSRDDAAELSMLSDAALCAERDGGRSIDRDDSWDPQDSPGWRWVREMLLQSSSRIRRTTDEKIDKVAQRLRVEPRAFATCRAQQAGTSINFIEAARKAGVRSTPATIVNGRVYGPINDEVTLQLLVETELAPGLLAPSWAQPELIEAR